MKKLLLITLIICSGILLQAQAPRFFNYQGVARNSVGNVLSNRTITLRLSVHDASANGPVVYSETRTVSTNPFGLFNVQVGSSGATIQTGSLGAVNWSAGKKFIQVEIDPAGASSFMNIGTTELASVPFSLYAESGLPIGPAGADLTGSYPDPTVAKIRGINVSPVAPAANHVLGYNGSSWAPTSLATHPDNYWRQSGNNIYNNNTGNIAIGGNTNPAEKLHVSGTARFTDNVTADKNIRAADTVSSAKLMVTGTSADYVAVFNNQINGNGDGIKIKLGKTHPMWDGGGYLSTTDNVINSFTPQINTVKNWVLNGTPITAGDVISLVTSTGQLLLGTLCQLTNFLTSNLNTALNLPLQFPGLNFPGWHILDGFCIFPDLQGGCALGVPPLGIPAFQILPSFPLIPAIPQINCGGLPTIQAPNMSVFNVSNSLTNENNFIVFTDKDDRELGAVRAQSIEEFRNKTLDISYFFEMVGKFSGVDLSKGLLLGAGEMAKLAFRYNKIGVEYASGHGDYAEWLERENLMENITAGDIVRVKSGKITRDLIGAEQIMVVSHRPIVLGNMPEKDKQPLGNAVAFMGQVPVKVMGPVNGGDYIVAKGDFAGMGVAVKPENMTTEDFRLCVGRSWETNENDGPKMVNTVVGVHNNDFLKIVADLQQKTQTTELRLKMIEEKLNISAGTTKNPDTNKKAF